MIYPIITGLLGTLIGLFLGHRLSLGRDVRKEFNVATKELRSIALRQLDVMSDELIGIPVDNSFILELRSAIGEKKAKEIVLAFKVYRNAESQVFKTDIPSSPLYPQKLNLNKIPEYKESLIRLLETLKPK